MFHLGEKTKLPVISIISLAWAGVCGPWKHPQTKKRWTKAIVSLRWMSLCLHRCDGHLGRMTPLPSVSSGQWPLQYRNYSHLGHRGVPVPRSELSHLCLNGILIFFIWMMLCVFSSPWVVPCSFSHSFTRDQLTFCFNLFYWDSVHVRWTRTKFL